MLEYLFLGTGLFGADLLLKEKIERDDPKKYPRDLRGSGGKVMLYRNHNPLFSFSFLNRHPELVRVLPMCLTSASAGILLYLLTHEDDDRKRLEKLGYTLITAGSLSNLTDRLRRGYVVDYLQVKAGPLKKIVFNLGDAGIAGGMILAEAAAFLDAPAEKKPGNSQ